MENDIKKMKLYFIQNQYNIKSSQLLKLQYHIHNLETLNLVSISESNKIQKNVYNLIKELNNNYNDVINDYLSRDNTDINFLYGDIENKKLILDIVKNYNDENINKNIFKELNNKIKNIIKDIGYPHIKDLLLDMYDVNYEKKLPIDVIKILNEINDIVIPISYNIFNVSNENKSYYWRKPLQFKEDDILEKTREIWIKIQSEENKYIKIELLFKIDKLSCIIKTGQITRPLLYNKKIDILNKITVENNINTTFIKTLIKHDYLGNMYCYDTDNYIKYILDLYLRYSKLIDSTFVNMMKDFVSEKTNVKKMFDIIFLLLLGNNESIDIACLLLGLLKEKKGDTKNLIYNLFQDNLTIYLQNKVKKSSINIKNELDKIKNISVENIDYRKQLVINKDIPNNIKSLVLEKIEEMKSFNNEYYKQLTYVKTILNFPWPSKNDDLFFNSLKKNNKQSKDYLTGIENKLQNLCYGHDEAKQSLLQIIGKWISNPKSQGACLGLVGPPGVGKTLLASSVSKALDIPFGQITLGGQNDGELLHGHGYTYSGSQPGIVVKKMVDMGKSRCILYFDELDKACSKHGQTNEITSILIHLTDPNMNDSFQDRFFQGVDFPLNKVIFIFSYNDSSKVDPILLDRIKEIKVSPYTLTDKLNICQKFVIPEVQESINLNNKVKINNNLLEYIIDNYTNESGVRSIKRKLVDINLNLNIDKIYQRKLYKKDKKTINLTKKNVLDILSEPIDNHCKISPDSSVGIINGLYATTTGDGGIIPIQIYKNIQYTCNNYEIKLTGKQGDVMKESVSCSLTAAIDYIKNNKEKYNISDFDEYMNTNFKHGFHIHTPSTSTPKDGPSAGCAFTCCFISRILNKKINNEIGMTGEVELTGKVTKIGGLEFKLQGAKKAGIKTVYVSSENEMDVTIIKKKFKNLITNNFKVITFSNVNEIIDDILV
jgi:ATP-dependent Lon protease